MLHFWGSFDFIAIFLSVLKFFLPKTASEAFWRGGGGTIIKQAPFWGVNFSLVRNMRGVKFYDTETVA